MREYRRIISDKGKNKNEEYKYHIMKHVGDGLGGGLVAENNGHQTGRSLVRGHGLTYLDMDQTWNCSSPRGLSLHHCRSAPPPPYSPNICSPGAVHGCPLLCVFTVCCAPLCSHGWVKSRGQISPHLHVVCACACVWD